MLFAFSAYCRQQNSISVAEMSFSVSGPGVYMMELELLNLVWDAELLPCMIYDSQPLYMSYLSALHRHSYFVVKQKSFVE